MHATPKLLQLMRNSQCDVVQHASDDIKTTAAVAAAGLALTLNNNHSTSVMLHCTALPVSFNHLSDFN